MLRKEALALGLIHYQGDKPCKAGHATLRLVGSGECVTCKKERTATYHRVNHERVRELKAAWKQRNLVKERLRQRLVARKRKQDPKKKAESLKRWRARNIPRRNAYSAWRRSAKLRAIPQWADAKAINSVYELSRQLTKTTGEAHHVDHIIPLVGVSVCGLHVEYNLQILTSFANLSKGNKLPY